MTTSQKRDACGRARCLQTWRPVSQLTTFVTAMVALSIGTERIVEIIKGMISQLDGHDTWIQSVAVAAGAVIALVIGPHELLAVVPAGGFDTAARYWGAALLGLMASGGSAFWNHALDILGAIKDTKEKVAAAGK